MKYTDADISCSFDHKRKWKKNDNKKMSLKQRCLIGCHNIARALATFRNADKSFLDGYIMLLYVNNAHSILLTNFILTDKLKLVLEMFHRIFFNFRGEGGIRGELTIADRRMFF